ncbi:hypothetical protein OP256_001276 [Vibrio parahaemolyticus]|uniref:hypothetical protein n=1 Tax=Vibrio parahaemolyticus TaxID=670 RepID=UPI000FEC36FB|nr:hypothetical protein [Vibrio parahaemolyticus]EKC5520912.1 hypothetical protein [Vibrio parahaemolyticus]EKI0735590.1 hypothetical protein [Vibrio parahaemolyticus]HCG9741782.1 hypothetical protein [Vibrio parahaemolyticus]HCH1876101.1 hypothetical protein [Vibrio parahaemolyticus]
MIVTVQALEKCFYGGLLRYEGQRFPWEVPQEYIDKAAGESKQLEDVLPEYFELVGNAPAIKPKKYVLDDDGISNDLGPIGNKGPGPCPTGPIGTPGEIGQSDPLLHSTDGDNGGIGGDGDNINPEEIKKVLAGLDHSDDSLWTDTGEVRLSALKDKLGYRVNRPELDEIAPGFKRQIA